jgi:enamine deaminase RidA (YjgF/YER057c/UK114 family)
MFVGCRVVRMGSLSTGGVCDVDRAFEPGWVDGVAGGEPGDGGGGHASCQTGMDVSGALVGGSYGEQFVQAIANVDVALAAAGASGADVIAMTVYIVDYSPMVLEEIMTAAAGQRDVPALSVTLVGVSALWQPGVLVEISALAVV